MAIVSGTVAALGGTLISGLSDLFDDLFTTDEEKAAAKLKLLEAQQRGDLAVLEHSLSAIIAEAQSDDPWTSRARPTFLYLIYFIILTCFIGGIVGALVDPVKALQVANVTGQMLGAIPEEFLYLFGVGYLGYTGGRSFDKWNKHRKG